MADNKYTGGIQINTSGFEVKAKAPVDSRFRVINSTGLDELLTYEGLITYNEADKTYYQFRDGAWKALFVSSATELENKIKDYVTGEALTVMEFKGVTSTLPSTTGLT